jgi:hypothetical protein
MELVNAEAYLRKAASQMDKNTKPKLESIEKELTVVKAEVGEKGGDQRDRYEALRNGLVRLIH